MDKIKILDVFGQFKVGVGADAFSSGSAHHFVFPKEWEVQTDSDWKIYINDVRTILNDIPKCYASWCTKEGWWIAAIVKNENDARQGYAIISVCLGNNLPLYGLDAVRALDTLASEFMRQENWNVLSAEKLLNEKVRKGNFEEPNQYCIIKDLKLGHATPMQSVYSQPTAVRRYKTERELHDLFDNLGQASHKRFSRILYVADSVASSLTANSYKDITAEPIIKGYEIECSPADAKVSATKAMKGDEISITFKNLLEMPVTETFIVGQDSKYVTYDGNKIIVKRHNILRLLGEDRSFTIRCVDESGREITGWNARPTSSTVALAIDGNKCYFPQTDKVAQIGISLQGYQPANITVKLPEIAPEGHVETVTLKRYAATTGSNSNAPQGGGKPANNGPSTMLKAGLAVAIIILIVGLGLIFIPGGGEQEEPVATVNTDSIQQAERLKLTQADINYIKNNNSIDKAILKTDEFQALIDYIASGQIEAMCTQMEKCYGAINGNPDINDKLRQIYGKISSMKSAGQNDKIDKFAEACRDASYHNDPEKGTQINLNTLKADLDKITAPVSTPQNVSTSRPQNVGSSRSRNVSIPTGGTKSKATSSSKTTTKSEKSTKNNLGGGKFFKKK